MTLEKNISSTMALVDRRCCTSLEERPSFGMRRVNELADDILKACIESMGRLNLRRSLVPPLYFHDH